MANGLTFSPAFSQVATNPVVNSLLDDGDGSCTDAKCLLRDAIAFAAAGATIGFDPSLTPSGSAVIGLTAGQLDIDKNLTVAGPGPNLLAVTRSSEDIFRIFAVTGGSTVRISGMAITSGKQLSGAGINNAGTLTLTHASVANNHSSNGLSGGSGGGIYNTGTLTVSHSVLEGNSAIGGGAILSSGSLTVTNSTISGNTARRRCPTWWPGGGWVRWDSALGLGVQLGAARAGKSERDLRT